MGGPETGCSERADQGRLVGRPFKGADEHNYAKSKTSTLEDARRETAHARYADGGDHGCEHDDPGELDDDRRGEHGGTGGAGGGDDLADLVDARAGPDTELLVAETQGPLQQR